MTKFVRPTAAAKKTVTKAKPVITPTTKIEVEQPAPAATDAVDMRVDASRYFGIDDEVERLNVETACGDVGGDEH